MMCNDARRHFFGGMHDENLRIINPHGRSLSKIVLNLKPVGRARPQKQCQEVEF
jgi:hypothetical protein